jgi:hypothetical protein
VRAVFAGLTYTHEFAVGATVVRDTHEIARARQQVGADATRCRAVAGTLIPQCHP